jgi:hypothetical protein
MVHGPSEGGNSYCPSTDCRVYMSHHLELEVELLIVKLFNELNCRKFAMVGGAAFQ